MRIDKDGYYTLYHMVIPTIDWLEDRLTNEEYDMGVYEGIYVTDCANIYKVVDQQLLPCSYEELMTTPSENTTISRCVRDLFYYHDLYYCYINLCNQVFNKYILSCPEKSSDNNIYRYNSADYGHAAVIERLKDIAGELELEQEKPDDERDSDREFKLIYKQFIEGLKLSTGSRL